MNEAIKQMLEKYECHTWQDYEQALREVLQEVILVALWRGKFFEHAAFYGGTALRIFYHLDRFSEDLDFTLLVPDPHWSWASFEAVVKQELASFGFEVSFMEKEKKTGTAIKSAFLKTGTVQELIKIGIRTPLLKGVHPDRLIRIRVEVDTDPIAELTYEQKFLSQPIAISVKCVSEVSLFACKMHAALFRAWRGRVKGRDWYDVVWFARRKTPLDLVLFSKLHGENSTLTLEGFQKLAEERVNQLDISSAVEDILPFVRDQEAVQRSWTREFFLYWISEIQAVKQ
ncbi:MAG: nucleotidyl transferase AbiEii/AbiGii toxin family protein [Chlamydiae bacterium]|nr:nucleotidyl transferase AbiEii/AbiGii toxin family protein [Chlamydiota bacterium]